MEGFNIRLEQMKKGSVKIKCRAVEIFHSEAKKKNKEWKRVKIALGTFETPSNTSIYKL